MGTGIIVCGCNGSGKSTLAKELAKKLNYKFIDIEDCYFPKKMLIMFMIMLVPVMKLKVY